MKKLTYITLALVLVLLPFLTLANPSESVAQARFTDYKPGDFGYANVISLADRDIIKGYSDGSFRPNHNLNRADAAVLFQRALKLKASSGGIGFKDVPKGVYYTNAAIATKEAGIFRGNSDGTFGPKDLLTREQMASVLVRAFQLEPVPNKQVTINDRSRIAPIHLQDVITLYQNDVTKGKPGNVFDPKGVVTRAEFSVFLFRAIELENKVKEDILPPIGIPLPGLPASSSKLTSIYTVDANNNGRIDRINLQFSVSIDSSLVDASKFTVNGYTITSVQTSGSVITINLLEKSNVDTDARPHVSYSGTLKDASGNDIGTINSTASDQVKPFVSAAHLTTTEGKQITGVVSNTSSAITISFDLSAEPDRATLRDGKISISEASTMSLSNPLGGDDIETLSKGENNLSFASFIADTGLTFEVIRAVRSSFTVSGSVSDNHGNSRTVSIQVKMK